jgi:hypothetical protein
MSSAILLEETDWEIGVGLLQTGVHAPAFFTATKQIISFGMKFTQRFLDRIF